MDLNHWAGKMQQMLNKIGDEHFSRDVIKAALEVVFSEMKKEMKKKNEELAKAKADAEVLHRILYENDQPVYAGFWERDCDMAEGTFSMKFDSELEYQRFLVDFYKGAEGPQRSWRLSLEEYEEFHSYFRDRALEAYENGRGNAVIL
ncbi:hypothetical protein GF420_15775 [candidate division GN15 bacterium]|nr:hypothetical protein [candidate division GN15 bacterium]